MHVTIYGKPNCPYCVKAITLCESKGLEFDYLTVGEHITVDELTSKVHEVTSDESIVLRTVPQVFVTEDDTMRYIKGGFQGLHQELNG